MAGFSNFFPEDVPGAIPGGTYNEGDIVVFNDNFYGATASVTLSDPVVAADFDTGWALLSGGGGGVENNTTASHIPYWDGDSLEDSDIEQTVGETLAVDFENGPYSFSEYSSESGSNIFGVRVDDYVNGGRLNPADYIGATISFTTVDGGGSDDISFLTGNSYTVISGNNAYFQFDAGASANGFFSNEFNGNTGSIVAPNAVTITTNLDVVGETVVEGSFMQSSGEFNLTASNDTRIESNPQASRGLSMTSDRQISIASNNAAGINFNSGGQVVLAGINITDTDNSNSANLLGLADGNTVVTTAVQSTIDGTSTTISSPLTVTGETTLDTNLTGFLRADSGVVSTGTIDTIENNTTANHLPYWDGDSLEDSSIEYTPSVPESMGDETLATPTTLFQGTTAAPPQPTNSGFFFEGDQTSTFSLGDAIQAPDGEIVHITINPNTADPVRYLPDQGFQVHSGGPNGVNDSANDSNPLGGDDVRVTQVAYFPDNTWTLGDSVTLGTATYAAESPAVTYTNINFIGGDYSDYQSIRMFSSAFSGETDAGEDAFIAAAQVGDYYRFDALTTTGTNQMAWGAALVNSIFVVTDVSSNSLRGELVSNYTPAGIVGADENNGSTVSFTKMEVTFTANQTTVPAVSASTTVTGDLTVTGDTTLDTDLTGFLRADAGVISTGTIDTIENNTTANTIPYWDGDSLEDSSITQSQSQSFLVDNDSSTGNYAFGDASVTSTTLTIEFSTSDRGDVVADYNVFIGGTITFPTIDSGDDFAQLSGNTYTIDAVNMSRRQLIINDTFTEVDGGRELEVIFVEVGSEATVTTVGGRINVGSDLIVTSDLRVTGDTTLGGDLTVTGTIGDLTVTGEINGGTDTSPTLFVEGGTGGTAQQGAYQFRVVGSGEGGAAGYITFELE